LEFRFLYISSRLLGFEFFKLALLLATAIEMGGKERVQDMCYYTKVWRTCFAIFFQTFSSRLHGY
jgi:hypothetical protein